ncbi:hypothetical protein [Streptomyces sp. Act143]|nr:hypothetical protein [Streptomyces sp. Act143]
MDDAIGAALGTDDAEWIAETVALLEQLAERLSPTALDRLRQRPVG